MIFIPLPFVMAILMMIVGIQMMQRSEGSLRPLYPFLALIAAYAVQSVLVGLRWGYDLRAILPYQGVLACVIAAQAYLAFRTLLVEHEPHSGWRVVHFAPAVLVAVLQVAWRDAVGLVIILTFFGYGAALLWSARRGPDALIATRLDGVVMSFRALCITGATLVLSAATDMLISFDLSAFGGHHSAVIVSGVTLITLVALAAAAGIAGSAQNSQEDSSQQDSEPLTESQPPHSPQTGEVVGTTPTQEDLSVAQSVEAMMVERAIYKDTDLNLNRLARKLSLPARRVSTAINRVHQMSVSQFVNNYRIAEACHLLAQTDEPITRLMFECGFISKSNFNREFLRVKGESPSRWRQISRAQDRSPTIPDETAQKLLARGGAGK